MNRNMIQYCYEVAGKCYRQYLSRPDAGFPYSSILVDLLIFHTGYFVIMTSSPMIKITEILLDGNEIIIFNRMLSFFS